MFYSDMISLNSERVNPLFQFTYRCACSETLSVLDNSGIGNAGFKLLCGVTHAASARCSKQNDRLSRKIVGFKESIDDRWCDIPPDRETNKDRVVISDVRIGFGK